MLRPEAEERMRTDPQPCSPRLIHDPALSPFLSSKANRSVMLSLSLSLSLPLLCEHAVEY